MEPQPQPPPSRKAARPGGVIVPHQPTVLQRVLAFLVWAGIQAIWLTLRKRFTDKSGLAGQRNLGPVIVCVWHNRLSVCLPAYEMILHRITGTPGMAAMVSASKDGGFLAGILEQFNVEPVRGSSSRRGAQALLELKNWGERGRDLAITPDGPRGPRYVVQDGIMSLAQVTGLPIIPCSYYLGWKIVIKSWDRFQIPLPFSRCDLHMEAPMRVPRDATDAQREEMRQRLENLLRQITRD